jgi:Cys-rich repeat protein
MNRAFLALVLAATAACDQTRTLGSRWVKSQALQAAKGGTIEVPGSSRDPLAGSALRIEPGALPADTTITLEQGTGPLSTQLPAAGPVAAWGPADVRLAKPARMSLPFKLAAGQTTADLVVLSRDANGNLVQIDRAALSLEASGSSVQFSVDHLGQFQAAAQVGCTSDSQCAAGQVCKEGVCRACQTEGCACTLDADCLAPLVCHEGSCKDEGRDGGSPDGGHG